jgi:stage III sporulation protein SpoIIIAA
MPEIEEIVDVPSADIYQEDLEYILETLTTVYHFSLTHDLQNGYMMMQKSPKQSPLTQRIAKCRRRVESILEDFQEEEDTGDVPQE